MGKALQVINGLASSPGATITALTPLAGDSYTVRNARAGSKVRLLDAWASTATNLLMRIRSPLLHDATQSMRLQPPSATPYPLLTGYAPQELEPQDALTVELTGEAAAVDAAGLLLYYEDLPGADARLFDWADIAPNIENLFTVEVDLTSSGTSCNYSASVAINANFDTFRRNIDYALLGYECGATGVSLGITGADTSNLRVGGPLINTPIHTRAWFIELGRRFGLPCIPVFNSGNVGSISVDCVAQATSTAFKVGLHLAQLRHPLPGHGS